MDINVALILVLALGGSALIVATTIRSLKRMANEAAAPLRAQMASESSRCEIVCVGRGEIVWCPDAVTVRFVARGNGLPVPEAKEWSRERATALHSRLVSEGIGPRDIGKFELHTEEEADGVRVVMPVDVVVRDPSKLRDVERSALATGYSEDREAGRRPVSFSDAESECVDRAIDSAKAMVAAAARRFDIPSMDLALLSIVVEDVSEPGPNSSAFVKKAKAVWRRAA